MGPLAIVLFVATIGPPAFGLIDATLRPAEAFRAAGKLTKPGWMLILVLAVVFALVWKAPTMFATIAGTIASIIYIVDVRPAVQEMGGGPSRGSTRERW